MNNSLHPFPPPRRGEGRGGGADILILEDALDVLTETETSLRAIY
jgi:hypothetical protein